MFDSLRTLWQYQAIPYPCFKSYPKALGFTTALCIVVKTGLRNESGSGSGIAKNVWQIRRNISVKSENDVAKAFLITSINFNPWPGYWI